MPRIKSSIKRVAVNAKRADENRGIKSEVLSTVRKFKALIESGKVEDARKEYSHVVSVIDSAVSKGVVKKATADRKKARLAVALDKASK